MRYDLNYDVDEMNLTLIKCFNLLDIAFSHLHIPIQATDQKKYFTVPIRLFIHNTQTLH